MKKLFLGLCLLSGFFAAAQDCEYAVRVENEDGTDFRLTKEQIVYYKATPLNTDLVYFSLYEENNVPLLLFKFSRDSKSFPAAICIDKTTRLSFQLANGKIVSLRQAGEESCGYIDNLEGLDKRNNTVESFFFISPDALEKLKQSKITMMGLRTPTDKKDFVIASELNLSEEQPSYEPGNYFIENIPCIME